jgi:hypothetical protein
MNESTPPMASYIASNSGEPVLVRAPLEAPLISIPLDNTTHDGITSVD